MAEIAAKVLAKLAELKKQDPKIGTTAWLARETGIPRTNLDESINGRRLWRAGELEKVAAALGTTLEHII